MSIPRIADFGRFCLGWFQGSRDAPASRHERAEQIRRLRSGEQQILFSTVFCAQALFNEGLDIPEIDTVLFLRPTESAIVFLQQLGHDLRYRALLGGSLQLDRVSAERVLSNLRESLTSRRPQSWAGSIRAEVFAAFGLLNEARPFPGREGVSFDEASRCDVFFITLKKSERLFSPSTRYNDYAISPREFHWESQSLTREASSTGQRYILHRTRGSRVLLFVREENKRGGVTLPFLCLGFATYASHQGERIWLAAEWRFAGGCTRRSRGLATRSWRWRCEGAATLLLSFCAMSAAKCWVH